LVYVDDATSRLMQMHFCEAESTFEYFEATRGYLERYGKPVAFYSDKANRSRVNAQYAILTRADLRAGPLAKYAAPVRLPLSASWVRRACRRS
jgi:hypothetical protein